MVNCFWKEHNREERTYWKACQDEGEPFQDDHIFVSANLQERVQSCGVLDYQAFRGVSDHAPMVLEITRRTGHLAKQFQCATARAAAARALHRHAPRRPRGEHEEPGLAQCATSSAATLPLIRARSDAVSGSSALRRERSR